MLLAEIDETKVLTIGLSAMAVHFFLYWMLRSAQEGSAAASASRTLKYSTAMKVSVIFFWIVTVLIAGLALATAHGSENVRAALMLVGGFFLLTLVLHLETFGVRIYYNHQNIYTHSPWRRSRTIPIHSVLSCDFSSGARWYRIRTRGYGIIRLHYFLSGIPGLLKVLPCPTPPYPPFA